MRSDSIGDDLTPREQVPRGLAPLHLGDPASPALTLSDDQSAGHVILTTAHPTVFVGPAGIHALRHWAECFLDQEGANRSNRELWTANGMQQELGVSRRTVYNWIERDGFPRSFAEPVGGVPVWEADAIRAWLLTDRPRAGRPRASA